MHGAVREEEEAEEEYNLFNHSSKMTPPRPPPTPTLLPPPTHPRLLVPLGWRLVPRFIHAALAPLMSPELKMELASLGEA